jgi:hypothetical protein
MSDTPTGPAATGPTGELDQAHGPLRAPDGPTVSLGQAVKITGAARTTLQRRLHVGAIPGAERTAEGGWSIPLAGLEAAGYPIMPAEEPVPNPFPAEEPGPGDELAALLAERERLQTELRELRERDEETRLEIQGLREELRVLAIRAEVAEALAAERADRNRAAEVALHAALVLAANLKELTPNAEQSRRWWQRRRRSEETTSS